MIQPPVIIVTGLARAGLGLVGEMLAAGGVPPLAFVLVADPHRREPCPFIDPGARLGIFVDRTAAQLLGSIERQNADEGRAPLALHERRILRRQLVRDVRRARGVAIEHFSPLYTFQFAAIISDPARQALRLAHIIGEHYRFCDTNAALAVRRIHRPAPRIIRAPFRIVQ